MYTLYLCTMFIRSKSLKFPTKTNIDNVSQEPSVNAPIFSEQLITASYVEFLRSQLYVNEKNKVYSNYKKIYIKTLYSGREKS